MKSNGAVAWALGSPSVVRVQAERAKAVSLPWIDTDEDEAGRLNYKLRVVVREIKKANVTRLFVAFLYLISLYFYFFTFYFLLFIFYFFFFFDFCTFFFFKKKYFFLLFFF